MSLNQCRSNLEALKQRQEELRLEYEATLYKLWSIQNEQYRIADAVKSAEEAIQRKISARQYITSHPYDPRPVWIEKKMVSGYDFVAHFSDGWIAGDMWVEPEGSSRWKIYGRIESEYAPCGVSLPWGHRWLKTRYVFEKRTKIKTKIPLLIEDAKKEIEKAAQAHHASCPYPQWAEAVN